MQKQKEMDLKTSTKYPGRTCFSWFPLLLACGKETKGFNNYILKTFIHKSSVFAIALLIANMFLVSNAFGEIAIRGTATTGSSSNANLTINKPSGVVAGDVMIVNIVKYYGSSTTFPALTGWTSIASSMLGSSNQRYGAVLYRVVDGTEGANFTFAIGNSDYAAGSIVAFSGVDVLGATPFDVTPGSISTPSGGNNSSATITSITTNTANASVIMFGMNSSVMSIVN